MKPNGAPDKLYLDVTSKCGDTVFTIKNNDTDVEYTRTDAFIEKVCDAFCKVCKMPNCRSNECRMISDFKGHLKNI